MDIQEQIAINLRRIRVARGISQDELALISGVERAYVGHLERGAKNPTVKTLEKISLGLQCRVRDFFEEVEGMDYDRSTLPPGRKGFREREEF